MVAKAVNAAVGGSTDHLRAALWQFAALFAGAGLSGLVLSHLPSAEVAEEFWNMPLTLATSTVTLRRSSTCWADASARGEPIGRQATEALS
jgi:hypothetical protein